MTAYHGGKQRLGKQLAEIIVDTSLDIADDEDFDIIGYCEPFCGMLGVYQHIPDMFEEEGYNDLKYLAGDGNGSVIKMWQAAQKGWKPPTTCSEKKFFDLKYSKGDSAEKGYIGHQYSFGGQWFKGYSPKFGNNKNSSKASKNVSQISYELNCVKFNCGSYEQYSNLKGFVIYCDPPYSNSHCKYTIDFDSKNFWDWCKEMSKYNIIFVSNYTAPSGVKTIFKTNYKITGSKKLMRGDNKRVEKLYLL
jgi:site-specific DNA-adenine methylase